MFVNLKGFIFFCGEGERFCKEDWTMEGNFFRVEYASSHLIERNSTACTLQIFGKSLRRERDGVKEKKHTHTHTQTHTGTSIKKKSKKKEV